MMMAWNVTYEPDEIYIVSDLIYGLPIAVAME